MKMEEDGRNRSVWKESNQKEKGAPKKKTKVMPLKSWKLIRSEGQGWTRNTGNPVLWPIWPWTIQGE